MKGAGKVLLLIVILIVLCTVLGYLYQREEGINTDLKQEIETKNHRIVSLTNTISEQKRTISGSDLYQIHNVSSRVIKDVFTTSNGSYAAKKTDAKHIIDPALMKNLFAAKYSKLTSKTYSSQIRIYPYMTGNKSVGGAFCVFNSTFKNLENNESDTTQYVMELRMEKQENQWILKEINQISMKPAN